MLLEYRLESVLGAGAFGMTYLAWDTHLEKHVAIKEYLPTELAVRALDGSVVPLTTENDSGFQWGRDRFIMEARTLARFSHPNIVRVNRYFEANATGYMVMDYEKGESLSQLLRRAPQPGEAQLKAIVLPLLDGLQAVHETGFLHRDIKPSNVFIRESGVPVLLDFGAAREAMGGVTKSLTSVLTPGYAPLEQYSSDGNQGPWSDVYALAGVVYRALVNDNPPDAVSRMRADVVPERLAAARGSVSETLLKATAWALTLDEKQRPQSARDWQRVLLGEAPIPHPLALPAPTATTARLSQPPGPAAAARGETAPATPRVHITPRVGRPRSWAWAWPLGLVLIVAIVAMGAWNKQREGKQRALAETAREAAEREAEQRRREAERARQSVAPGQQAAIVQIEQPKPASQLARERPPRERDERPGDAEVEKFKRWAEADFRSADSDADGFLSADEVRRKFPYVAKEFHRADGNGDGRISPEEFMRFRKWQMLPKPPK